MIPKAKLRALASVQQLRDTTVEKDYVIGWVLRAISAYPTLSRWVFKGDTCLKKCFFETYRFSEDLDFTVALGDVLSVDSVEQGLSEVADWIEQRCGLRLPRSDLKVDQYTNPRGHDSYQAKLPFAGPLGLAPRSLQRVRFDLTQDEVVVEPPTRRDVHHGYDDAASPTGRPSCPVSLRRVRAARLEGAHPEGAGGVCDGARHRRGEGPRGPAAGRADGVSVGRRRALRGAGGRGASLVAPTELS